jgi:hypothetical protein
MRGVADRGRGCDCHAARGMRRRSPQSAPVCSVRAAACSSAPGAGAATRRLCGHTRSSRSELRHQRAAQPRPDSHRARLRRRRDAVVPRPLDRATARRRHRVRLPDPAWPTRSPTGCELFSASVRRHPTASHDRLRTEMRAPFGDDTLEQADTGTGRLALSGRRQRSKTPQCAKHEQRGRPANRRQTKNPAARGFVAQTIADDRIRLPRGRRPATGLATLRSSGPSKRATEPPSSKARFRASGRTSPWSPTRS